ncbi:hypothetical protein [Salinisphaera sp.]|uniref:hypothetical protein n=1 Tax=Salinisphaera sp. TaxID=1914330 RepID=UPI002D772EFB|nr:hypothetical protein [Salinisphaera sp.]HET7315367.1 hypothetical protein [Salinisphaera sp.]
MARHPSIFPAPVAAAVLDMPGLCLASILAWAALVLAGGYDGLWILVTLTVFSAVAFLIGALVSAIPHPARLITRVDGAAAGAMLAAALVLVVPHALIEHAGAGALGLLLGLGVGLALQITASGRGGRAMLGALTLHSICDGVVLGALYTLIPALGWGAGLAILAHKAPAGYALARRLARSRSRRILVVLPALGTGLGALCTAMMPAVVALPAGLIFGAAAGLFLFVALAFFASSARAGSLDAVDWLAFALGGAVIALVGWIAPHGI